MRRDLNTCSRQSAMHHGVRVRVFVGRWSTTAETTAATAHLGVTTYMVFRIFVVVNFLRVLYNNIHHHVDQTSTLHIVLSYRYCTVLYR